MKLTDKQITSFKGFSPKEKRSDVQQIEDLLNASKVAANMGLILVNEEFKKFNKVQENKQNA